MSALLYKAVFHHQDSSLARLISNLSRYADDGSDPPQVLKTLLQSAGIERNSGLNRQWIRGHRVRVCSVCNRELEETKASLNDTAAKDVPSSSEPPSEEKQASL